MRFIVSCDARGQGGGIGAFGRCGGASPSSCRRCWCCRGGHVFFPERTPQKGKNAKKGRSTKNNQNQKGRTTKRTTNKSILFGNGKEDQPTPLAKFIEDNDIHTEILIWVRRLTDEEIDAALDALPGRSAQQAAALRRNVSVASGLNNMSSTSGKSKSALTGGITAQHVPFWQQTQLATVMRRNPTPNLRRCWATLPTWTFTFRRGRGG